MHEENEETEGGAEGDEDAAVVESVVVGLLLWLGGAAVAGAGCGGGGSGAGDGAVWRDEVAGVVVGWNVVGVPEIRVGARRCEYSRDDEAEP